MEMVRILRPGGHEHRYPDGFSALAKYAKIEILEAHTDWLPVKPSFWHKMFARPDVWGETLGVFRKPAA